MGPTTRATCLVLASLAPLAACGGGGGGGGAAGSSSPPPTSTVVRYAVGDPADVSPVLSGPAHDLGGGGSDVDAAIQWMVDAVRGCSDCPTRLDVVVLRSSGADGYNQPILALNGVDSVETLVLSRPEDADRPEVEATVARAEVVFFAGGDQCDYVRSFRGTRVEAAVESVHARGGGVGGTSAGLAIQSEFVYDACQGSATSAEVLADPYAPSVSFTTGFFRWAFLEDTLAETHFVARDRMGRLMGFLARLVQDGLTPSALGVAVDESTSLVVDRDGRATVMGAGPAYLVLADHPPEVCARGRPLTYSGFRIWRLASGETYDLRERPARGSYLRSVRDGVIDASPY